MLVRLTSSTSGEVILFAPQARRLFEIIGKECTARGVFTLAQLPEAMSRLRQAVADEKDAAKRVSEAPPANPEREKPEDDDPDPTISLAQRAHPLIRLMERTENDGGFILWETDRDF